MFTGDEDAGRSAFFQTLHYGNYTDPGGTTIGAEFFAFNIKIEGKIIQLQV